MESERQLADQVNDSILNFVSSQGPQCDIAGNIVCHLAVNMVKRNGKDLKVGRWAFYRELTFIQWNEKKWDDMSQLLEDDNSWKKIKIKPFQELMEDIMDGTVNGHSFMKYKKWYIDPFFHSAGLDFKQIQRADKWIEAAYKKIGIT